MPNAALQYNTLHAHALGAGDDMARRRLQRKGDLSNANGFWWLRWREDRIGEDGETRRVWTPRIAIAPSEGPSAKSKRQAQRMAWENFLSQHDRNQQTPGSLMRSDDA